MVNVNGQTQVYPVHGESLLKTGPLNIVGLLVLLRLRPPFLHSSTLQLEMKGRLRGSSCTTTFHDPFHPDTRSFV